MIQEPGAPLSRGRPDPSPRRRFGTMPPPRRAISRLLDWIEEAEASQWIWARNRLIVVATMAALLWLAMRLGLLRQ